MKTLAIAMNRIGRPKQYREGGEDPAVISPIRMATRVAADQAGRLGALWRHESIPGQRE